jgi:outer membrane protein
MLLFSKRLLGVGLLTMAMIGSAAANTGVKIGVVNVGLILEQAPQAKAASSGLEREFAPQQSELVKLNEQLEKEQNDLQRNRLAMSEAQLNAKDREIAMLTREIQRKRNDIQELLNIRRNEELANLQGLVNMAIREIGTTQSYDLILYEGIAYTNNRVDITQAVLDFLAKEFNKQQTGFNR